MIFHRFSVSGAALHAAAERLWYHETVWARLLLPVSWLFARIAKLRRWAYRRGVKQVTRLRVPVIVVGNISVGGTGKTPLVVWLAGLLKQAGFKPGIVSRGYGGAAFTRPQDVIPESEPDMVGDEAVLISRRTLCPMVVGPDRAAAARHLLEHALCDVIIADDGLQHYALGRDIEIAVVDGTRRFGNGFCLPAGPLREAVDRLEEVDFVVCHGKPNAGEYTMRLEGDTALRVAGNGMRCRLADLGRLQVHAVTGIGNPIRFFEHLKSFGLTFDIRVFPDHHRYRRDDIAFPDRAPVLMTEKDAVKCRAIADDRHWYVPIHAVTDLGGDLLARLKVETDG